MSYQQLDDEQKKKLLSLLNWDYKVTSDELLKVIKGEIPYAASFDRENLFARGLATFDWETIVNIWGLQNCIALYTDKVRRMLFPRQLKDIYDRIFAVLRGDPLPPPRQSSEDLERLRSTLLSNRRDRCQQGVFQSPILRRF